MIRFLIRAFESLWVTIEVDKTPGTGSSLKIFIGHRESYAHENLFTRCTLPSSASERTKLTVGLGQCTGVHSPLLRLDTKRAPCASHWLLQESQRSVSESFAILLGSRVIFNSIRCTLAALCTIKKQATEREREMIL